VFTHKLESKHGFHLSFIVKSEGLYKVTGSHAHCKSGNSSETVLDRDVVTTGQEVTYDPSNSSNCDDSECP